MFNNRANEFRNILSKLKNINVEENANFKLRAKLFEELNSTEEITRTEARAIVAFAKIEVSEDFITSNLLDETVNTYVEMLVKVKKALSKIDSDLFLESIKVQPVSIAYD